MTRQPTPHPLTVGFVIEASTAVGLGHMVRSCELARYLRASGVEIGDFLVFGEPWVIEQIRNRGFNAQIIDHAQSIVARECDWMVVDMRSQPSRVCAQIREQQPKCRVLALDYLNAENESAVDVIVNVQNQSTAAPRLVAKYVEGLEYMILREQFTATRGCYLVREMVQSAIIALGGSDPTGYSALAVTALQQTFPGIRIRVVGLGPGPRDVVESSGIEVLGDVEDMAELMLASDVGIVSGGTTLVEAACLGLPAVVVPRTHEERHLATLFAHAGSALISNPSPGSIAAKLVTLRESQVRMAMSSEGPKLVDGLGAHRVSSLILGDRKPS